jgi:AcrR family transcriptional regulator
MGLKGDLQKVKVIESASYCLTHFGERGATFQAIADHCKISQASVVKYLKTRENIFPTVLDYWITRARSRTQDAVKEDETPEQKLRRYLQVSRDLFHETHEVSIVMLTLHYLSGIDEKYRLINSQIKDVAQKRIAGFIDEGMADGSFRKVNSRLVAKTIHNTLMGFLMSSVTEVSHPSDLQLPDIMIELCVSLVKA